MIGKLIRYFISFCYCCFLKLKYRQKLIINPFKVYISILSEIKITGTGIVQIDSSKGRVYISPYSSIVSSGGNIYIGSGVFFNKNVNIVSHDNIYIGENCLLGTTYAVSILIIDIMIFLKIYVIKVTLNRQSELSAMSGFAQV